ncbi:hypothetical protein ENBRE01_0304 [Enteropsectra breve]|nr:hypothetical protein ENBRE01_0304 [Enteropsectra breve]
MIANKESILEQVKEVEKVVYCTFITNQNMANYTGLGPYNTKDHTKPAIRTQSIRCGSFDNISCLLRGYTVFDSKWKIVEETQVDPSETYFVAPKKLGKNEKLIFIKIFNSTRWCLYPDSLISRGAFAVSQLEDILNLNEVDGYSAFVESADGTCSTLELFSDEKANNSGCVKSGDSLYVKDLDIDKQLYVKDVNTDDKLYIKDVNVEDKLYIKDENTDINDNSVDNDYSSSNDNSVGNSSNSDNSIDKNKNDGKNKWESLKNGDVVVFAESKESLNAYISEYKSLEVLNVFLENGGFTMVVEKGLDDAALEKKIEDFVGSAEIQLVERKENKVSCYIKSGFVLYVGIAAGVVDINHISHVHLFLIQEDTTGEDLLKKFRTSKFSCMSALQFEKDLMIVESFKESVNVREVALTETFGQRGSFVVIQERIKNPMRVCFYRGLYKLMNYPFLVENPGTIRALRKKYFFSNKIVRFDGTGYSECDITDEINLRSNEILLIEE